MSILPRAAPKSLLTSHASFWKSHEHFRFPLPAACPSSRFPLSSSPRKTMIDLRYVKKLVEMLDESSVDSIEISSDKGMKIRISKTPQQRGAVQVAAPMAMPALLPAAAPPAPAAEASSSALGVPKLEPPKSKFLEVKSPMVGTYYGAPEPGAKPY